MPEDNQIQPGFQPGIQANPQIQKNNLAQNGQPIQQNNVGSTNQRLEQNIAKHTQNIYYHPTRLTKILSGIYRFLGIALVRAGLRNFSLIGTEDLSFLKILYVGGVITLCGILYIFLGRLLYSTKKKIHFGFSLLGALAINIMFARILISFTGNFDDVGSLFGIITVLFTIIYFSILTFKWIVKCHRFEKKGIIDSKYLDQIPSKKKVGLITTIILLLPIIICLIYGKIQWPKIPEIDESIFQRTEHQTKLPDEQDALVQLKKYDDFWEQSELRNNLTRLSFSLGKYKEQLGYKNENCFAVYSGGNAYCGTEIQSIETIKKLLNYDFEKNSNQNINNQNSKFDIKSATLMEYLDKNHSEIKNNLLELNRILSLDYYIPNEECRSIIPDLFLNYSDVSNNILMKYFILKKEWNMVLLIFETNHKMSNITANIGGWTCNDISLSIENRTNYVANSSIKILPKNIRIQIADIALKTRQNREDTTKKIAKGEYAKRKGKNLGDIVKYLGDPFYYYDEPSIRSFLFHFPFYSHKDTDGALLYIYNMIYYGRFDYYKFSVKYLNILHPSSLYNFFGRGLIMGLMDLSPESRLLHLERNILKNDALISNLKAGDFKVWFEKPDRETHPSSYYIEQNRLQLPDM